MSEGTSGTDDVTGNEGHTIDEARATGHIRIRRAVIEVAVAAGGTDEQQGARCHQDCRFRKTGRCGDFVSAGCTAVGRQVGRGYTGTAAVQHVVQTGVGMGIEGDGITHLSGSGPDCETVGDGPKSTGKRTRAGQVILDGQVAGRLPVEFVDARDIVAAVGTGAGTVFAELDKGIDCVGSRRTGQGQYRRSNYR